MLPLLATARIILRNYVDLPRMVYVLCFGSFINRAGSFVMLFLTIYVTEQLGAGKAFASYCIGAFGFGSVVSSLIGGQLADQFGRRATMLLALFGGATALLILNQLATVAQSPAGFTQLAAAEGLASLESINTAAFEPGSVVMANSDAPSSLRATLRHVAGDWTFLLFCFCNLLTSIVFMQGFATLPLYVTEMGFTKLEFGTMICVNGGMIVLLQLPLTHVLNHCNRALVLLAGELFLAVGFGLTVYADSAMFFVGTIVLWTMGEIFQAPYKPTIVSELAPPAMRARYMGVFNLSHSLSLMIGAPLGGEILARFGPQVLWPGCFCLLIITMALYVLLFSRLTS